MSTNRNCLLGGGRGRGAMCILPRGMGNGGKGGGGERGLGSVDGAVLNRCVKVPAWGRDG